MFVALKLILGFCYKSVYFTMHDYQIEKIHVKDFNSQISMFSFFFFAFYFGEYKISDLNNTKWFKGDSIYSLKKYAV